MTPESIILYFSSVIRQNLILGKKKTQKEEEQAGQAIISSGRSLNIGAPPRGWNLEEEINITQQISLRKLRAHYTECNATIGQIATPGPI